MLQRRTVLVALWAAAAVVAGLISTAPDALAASTPLPDPYSPSYGHPYRHGAVPKILPASKMAGFEAAHRATTTSAASPNTLSYGGGIDGAGVTSGMPKVYLVFWGSQWGTQAAGANGDLTLSNDYDSGAPYLQQLFKGIGTGGERWSATMTQYCDGPLVVLGATTCPASATHVGYPTGGALAGVWYDNASPEPSVASGNQIGQVAVAAAAHFGNTSATSNRYAQYIIASAPGTDPDNYQDPTYGFCGWHDFTADPTMSGGPVASLYGDLAFTNLPYIMDPASAFPCGQGSVNTPGTLDGYGIVAGHEYAETLTDPYPVWGWSSSVNGNENGDDCAWITSGPGAMADVALTTGSFAMQSTWSNAANQCQMYGAVANPSSVIAVSGSNQSARIGATYSGPLVVKLTDLFGNPIVAAPVSFIAPNIGPSVTFAACPGGNPQPYECTAFTDSDGIATSSAATANSSVGPVLVTAASPGLTPAVLNLTNATATWSGWIGPQTSPPPGLAGAPSGPAVASWGPGRLDLFVEGADANLWHRWSTDGGASWSAWEDLGGVLVGGPAAVSWGLNRLDVFVRGSDDQLWHKWWDGSSWRGWEPLGGRLTSSPAVSSWSAGRLDVFADGTDGAIWHKWWGGQGWAGWESLGGVGRFSPAAASWGPGRIDLFTVGTDGGMYHKFYENGWSGWFKDVSSTFASGPGVTSWGPGRLDLFAASSAPGNPMSHLWYAGSWGSESLGGQLTSAPGVVSRGFPVIDTFVQGTDHNLWYQGYGV